MPINFKKGFARRKSSGNVLEELENPPAESSFRVLERPRPQSKSIDAGNGLSRGRGFSVGRPQSFEDGSDESHRYDYPGKENIVAGPVRLTTDGRGSGGTTNSGSTGVYDSSSGRYSSTSTLPSSTDHEVGDDLFPRKLTKSYQSVPSQSLPQPEQPKSGFTIKAGGRTFSFAAKHKNSDSKSKWDDEGYDNTNSSSRDRALTASSYASTARPPKLDSNLDLGSTDFGDDFGNMFAGIGKRGSTLVEEPESIYSSEPKRFSRTGSEPALPSLPPKGYTVASSKSYTPAPIRVDRQRDIEASPYSWDSHDSHDGLMSSPIAGALRSGTPDVPPPVPKHNSPLPPSEPSSSPPSYRKPINRQGSPIRSPPPARQRSSDYIDTDAQLVADSARTSRYMSPPAPASKGPAEKLKNEDKGWQKASFSSSSTGNTLVDSGVGSGASSVLSKDTVGRAPSPGLFDDTSFTSSTSSYRSDALDATPRAKKATSTVKPANDDSMFASASLVNKFMEKAEEPQNKVMTPKQFAAYQRQKEASAARGDAQSEESESEEEDPYEEEDETTRNRELAKQRQKQEAQLAVYRQQMMKVTGEQPDLPEGLSRPGMGRNNASAPNLTAGMGRLSLGNSSPVGQSSEEEDEDVPLGILQAHGFPNKNRPPNKLNGSTSNPNLRAASQAGAYPPPPPSVAGEGPRGNLPVFARNLPPDPYFGAGLVNPVNRESLAFANSSAGSVYGGNATPAIPPGGLVGVIAGEERARAMRRGSPGNMSTYGQPLPLTAMGNGGMMGMGRNGMIGPMGPMGLPMGMGMPPMISPQDQAQMQMNQQMTQMMQMQMQFMQQMMQMQGQGGQPMPGMPNMPGMPGQPAAPGFLAPPGVRNTIALNRPMSMASNSSGFMNQQRTMSMMGPPQLPPMPGMGMPGGYAPSMHNFGMAPTPGPGYTPSIAPSERSNIGMPSRYRPVTPAANNKSANGDGRTSTFTSEGTLQAFSNVNGQKKDTIKVVEKPRGSQAHGQEDEDEEAGWAEMRRKREAKKSRWRLGKGKKETEGMEGLYYE